MDAVKWEAASHWITKSQLPPDAKPLAFILYADKTRLSSFGTVKGYPVVVGYIVGWLPIVNFKNSVWHESFARITSSLVSKSKTGQWYSCLDSINRWFFLCVLILSADYEEQCIMSLTRGIMSLWPCPICLEKDSYEEQEEVLKQYGLRDIINSLWAIRYSDVHRALSHD
ncbi:uncharacterized protein EDB93DRAFT_1239411 [Suillus bovinus]|uniref:uncharacterized protein n=1 Tax=Suillus bovinus TaxID=48563 RepID=UPI001B867FAE|nr:uncharacterized protein EDB93DRAFT_1239411 [Suillus bovinus]KAG2155159.1 hypothetical protein EDB93DRAFT_1239411 [Suillus bovinus]